MVLNDSPIFIIGAPRCGAGLLRTQLDSHPNIASAPEIPWENERPVTVGSLVEFLCDESTGYCRNFGGTRAEVFAAARLFVESLFRGYAQRRGKTRWVEHEDVRFLPFLAEMFPNAIFLHMRRDVMDIAALRCAVAEPGSAPEEDQDRYLPLFPHGVLENNAFTSALRHLHWDRQIQERLRNVRSMEIHYEELVSQPEDTMKRVLAFAGEEWSPQVLETPQNGSEQGLESTETLFRLSETVGTTCRGARAISDLDREILDTLRNSERPTDWSPRCRLGSVDDLRSDRFTRFMGWLNSFAGPLGLRIFTNWGKIWEYPWLWFHGLSSVRWAGARLVDIGSEISPMPWFAAMLGARVTLIETDPQWVGIWEKLKAGLGVQIDWHIVTEKELPFPSASVDVVTSFSVIEHQEDKDAAISEIARILKPGGMLAMSYDICEEGMTFPAWNGKALNIREFEDLVWLHPAFGMQSRPEWNRSDMAAFKEWHLESAPHHDYVVGAAVLRRTP